MFEGNPLPVIVTVFPPEGLILLAETADILTGITTAVAA